MRNVTCALVVLVAAAGIARGQKGKESGKEAPAGAMAALDRSDAAFNAHDAKALIALFDKSYFGAGATVGKKLDYDGVVAEITTMLAKGGRLVRDSVTMHGDEDGATAWYIADYTFVPQVPRGALPVHRKLRESGVLIKHGKEWRFAMTHLSMPQPDEQK
ncbi:MAG TPA: nuclear transport factor 2 family protein [Polyangia bacterium]